MSLKARNAQFFRENCFVEDLLDDAELFLHKALGYPANVFILEKALAKRLETEPNYEVWVPLRYYRSANHSFPGTPLFIQSSSFWISSTGNMYNTKRLVKTQEGSINDSGYPTYCFTEDGVETSFVIHRAVACGFVTPKGDFKNIPLVRLQVNHLNGVKTDRVPSNLEWCTAQHNIQHAHGTGLSEVGRGVNNPLTRPLLGEILTDCQYKGTKFILAGFEEAQKYRLGGAHRVIAGRVTQFKGCTFTLALEEDIKNYLSVKDLDEEIRIFLFGFDNRTKGKIIATNLKTGEQTIIKDTKHMKELGFTNPNVYACCNGKMKEHKGYSFKREEARWIS